VNAVNTVCVSLYISKLFDTISGMIPKSWMLL